MEQNLIHISRNKCNQLIRGKNYPTLSSKTGLCNPSSLIQVNFFSIQYTHELNLLPQGFGTHGDLYVSFGFILQSSRRLFYPQTVVCFHCIFFYFSFCCLCIKILHEWQCWLKIWKLVYIAEMKAIMWCIMCNIPQNNAVCLCIIRQIDGEINVWSVGVAF